MRGSPFVRWCAFWGCLAGSNGSKCSRDRAGSQGKFLGFRADFLSVRFAVRGRRPSALPVLPTLGISGCAEVGTGDDRRIEARLPKTKYNFVKTALLLLPGRLYYGCK